MLKVNTLDVRGAQGGPADGASSLDLSFFLGVLRRQWPTLVAVAAAIVTLAVIYVLTAPPRFTASATILIDTRKNQLLATQQVVGEQVLDATGVESQVEILKSDSIALAVVRDLKLANNPVFMGGQSVLGSILSALTSSTGTESESERELAAADTLGRNLQVKRVGLTYAIEIGVTTLSPTISAEIANAICDAYSVGELDSRYQATKRASRWLQDRIQELREQATLAESNVQKFRSDNTIIDTGRGLLSEQQLADVNSQLAGSRAATAEAKAKLDRIQSINAEGVPNATVADALRNDVITRLRAQYLDISAREADWSLRFGANHVAVRNLRNQMNEIRRSILDEVSRIAETYKSELEIARAREQSLQESLAGLVASAGTTGQAQVRLRDLESSAQTYRNLYDNFLQRFMEATQQQTFPISEARVISAASPPKRKSAPRAGLILAASLGVGSLLGFSAAIAREKLGKSVFLTLSDIESETGIECLGVLPAVQVAQVAPTAPVPGRLLNSPIARQTVDAPFSRFSETLRAVKVAADLNTLSRRSRVIGVVSALPNEGKTTIAANLAATISASGRRVLLIDGDLRNPSLTRLLTPDAEIGLVQVIRGERTVETVLRRDDETGMSFLPAVVKTGIWQTAEMLTSDAMTAVLESGRENYDYVIIDLPPILPVVDVRAVAHMIDSFVMTVEWGVTSREAVLEALDTADTLREKLLGIILNKANPSQLKRLEGYKGRYYKSYYRERSLENA